MDQAVSPARARDATASTTSRIVLPVEGMTCASCVAHVEKALRRVAGVARVAVNLATESAAVEGAALDLRALARAVGDAGYAVPTQTIRLAIEGMTCASCVARLESALRAVPGVMQASVNLASESARVEAVAGAATTHDLLAAVSAAGYSASVQTEAIAAPADRSASLRRDALLALALALPLLLGTHLDLLGIDARLPASVQWLLATPVQFWCARRFYVAAAKAVRAGTGNMDLLVSLGTLAAYGLSLYLWLAGDAAHPPHLYFEAASVVIALVLLGRWLEGRAKHQTSEAIRLLAALRPTTAHRLDGDRIVDVPVEQVRLGRHRGRARWRAHPGRWPDPVGRLERRRVDADRREPPAR